MVKDGGVQRLRSVAELILGGAIAFDDFYTAVPHRPGGLWLGRVYDDLEDALEHIPSRLRGGVDMDAWERSPERTLVLIDLLLLSDASDTHDEQDLMAARDSLASCPVTDEATLRSQVERALKRSLRSVDAEGP